MSSRNSNRLQAVRTAAKLSKRDLSVRSGVTVKTITATEEGRERMTGNTARKLAAVLNVKPEYLLGLTPESAYISMDDRPPRETGYYCCLYRDDRFQRPLFSLLWFGSDRFWRLSYVQGISEVIPSDSILAWLPVEVPEGAYPG